MLTLNRGSQTPATVAVCGFILPVKLASVQWEFTRLHRGDSRR